MIRLLDAGFMRLMKGRVFWLFSLFSVGLAGFMIFMSYRSMVQYGGVIDVAQLLLNYSTMIGIVIAIFTSLFLGSEYSEGAIRNKISIGHKRTNIYLCNLILTITVSFVAYLLFILVILFVGIPLFGAMTAPIPVVLKALGGIFMAIVAYCGVFTFIAMMMPNKAVMAITSLVVSVLMMMGALTGLNILQTPEFIQTTTIVNQETGEYKMEQSPNPKYPSESEREMIQLFLDINPAGQMYQIAGRGVPNLTQLPLYAAGVLVIFTGAGLVLFRKKDLK